MVVVPEPAVKCSGAFAAGAVDRSVGPACEHRADEAFGFAVCLWPVGPGTEVFDPEPSAGDRVQGGAVARAVVGEELLDGDPVAAVKGDGAAKEAGSCFGGLVVEDFCVSETAVVVDGDVDE